MPAGGVAANLLAIMAGIRTIVGLGEALFDLFPDEQRLGGAPLNVAVHAQQLGNRGVVVTRVGQDSLGDQILAELRRRGMDTTHVQTDPDHATGTVLIDFDEHDEPHYQIVENVAWDLLQWDGDLDHLSGHCDAVCFGTLAQRNAQTRNNIYRFVSQARRAIKLFDINLRQDYYDRQQIEYMLDLADALKVNRDELTKLTALFHLEDDADAVAAALMGKYKLEWLALTAGEAGTTVYAGDDKHTAASIAAEAGGDAVGAGDATAAALLHGALRRWDWPRTLDLANRLGAFVAGQKGACPELPDELKQLAGVPVARADQPEQATADEQAG